MRYRLRTLLIVLALGPIVLAGGFRAVEEHLRYRRMREELSKISSPPRPPTLIAVPAGAGTDIDPDEVDPVYPHDSE